MNVERQVVRGETRASVWRRRVLTVPLIFVSFVVVLALSPIWIPTAALVDSTAGARTAWLRSGSMLMIYLACEVIGVGASVVLWIGRLGDAFRQDPLESSFRSHVRLQTWWAGTLMNWARRLFRISFSAEGLDVLDRPMILMLTHSSLADTLLATEFVSKPHEIHLRYLLKQELLVDPCLDIVGHRLPNYFVDRDSDDPEDVRSDVLALLSDLRGREGALIYPEGTRFSSAKRERLISRFEAKGDLEMAERTRRLRHTLPPRVGGALAMLDADSGLDVVFCAHRGFGAARRPTDLLGGALLDTRVEVRFERVPCEEIPSAPEARREWLFEQWKRMDDWIESKGGAL